MQTGMLRLLTYHEVAGAEKDARLLQEAPSPAVAGTVIPKTGRGRGSDR